MIKSIFSAQKRISSKISRIKVIILILLNLQLITASRLGTITLKVLLHAILFLNTVMLLFVSFLHLPNSVPDLYMLILNGVLDGGHLGLGEVALEGGGLR